MRLRVDDEFWVVINPTPRSGLRDTLFSTTLRGLKRQFDGGLTLEMEPTIYDCEEEAQRDAERRDFTMNALSVSSDGTIHDHVGGLADIETRRVRFIGDAATRIDEDYLRILRFFRFHASYGVGAPDPAGLAACIAGRAGLEQLSRERIRTEIVKLLLARRAVPALAVTGILQATSGGRFLTYVVGVPGSHELRKRANGTRSASVTVPRGTRLRFRYLAEDGRWFNDPDVEHREGADDVVVV